MSWWEQSREEMTLDHIQKLFERVIRIEDQFAEIDSREVDETTTDEDTEENGGDLVPLNADVADENDVMPGFYELEDFEYCSFVYFQVRQYIYFSTYVVAFVLAPIVAAPHGWVKLFFSGIAILRLFFSRFWLM